MTDARERTIITVLGGPGMGKTGAVIAPLIARYKGEVMILDASGALGHLESERVTVEWPGRRHAKQWIDELTAEGEGPKGGGWGPGLLVLDDADRYLTAVQSVDSFRDVWISNRHLGLDVIVSAHRPQGIPKDLIASSHELWLFAQEEPRARDYLMEIRSVRAAAEAANNPLTLPTEPGKALRVRMRGKQAVSLVELF